MVRVENLGKRYSIGHAQQRHDTLRDALVAGLRWPPGRSKRGGSAAEQDTNSGSTIWALRDLTLEVRQGEALGIIGRNGAGKSTLLKILSRITEPTEGHAVVRGRVGSLLEVGTGFHPELTGRENIYLNGAILGMRRTEISRRFDEIVAFAETAEFLDTPVKRYSSGMYTRLAFAVAAHLEPEILLVDEVLAVGDAGFQKKCLGKMGDVTRAGRTVLFVSHNLVAVQTLCDQAVWLDHGRMKSCGNSHDVTAQYLASFQSQVSERRWASPEEAPGNDHVRLRRAAVLSGSGEAVEQITVQTPITLKFEYWNREPNARHSLSMSVSDGHGALVFLSESQIVDVSQGVIRGVCRIPGDLLNDEVYRITLIVCREKSSWIHAFEDVLSFEVHDITRQGAWLGKWPGTVRPALSWTLAQAEKGG